MPKPTKNYLLEKWAPLLRAVRLNEAKLAGARPFLEALERAYSEAVLIQKMVDGLREGLRQAVRQRNESLAKGYDADVALRNYIKSVLGTRSEELRLYRIKPRPKRSRRDKKSAVGC